MTHNDFIVLMRNPESVAALHMNELREMVDQYPYFAPARILYTKTLQLSNSILFDANLKTSSIYTSNRQDFYYYLYPDKKISLEPYRRDRAGKSGDYFEMINTVTSEGGDTKQSLKNLAERLKSARSLVAPVVEKVPAETKMPISLPTNFNEGVVTEQSSLIVQITSSISDSAEDNAKKLIREHKYSDAIVILRELNLNNPKKSVYFADQIRFLEKIIANSKK